MLLKIQVFWFCYSVSLGERFPQHSHGMWCLHLQGQAVQEDFSHHDPSEHLELLPPPSDKTSCVRRPESSTITLQLSKLKHTFLLTHFHSKLHIRNNEHVKLHLTESQECCTEKPYTMAYGWSKYSVTCI